MTISELLKLIEQINMGTQDKTAYDQRLSYLKTSVNNFVGTREEVSDNEKDMLNQIETFKREWREKQEMMLDQYWCAVKAMVEEEKKVLGNPRCEKAWALEWEYGHSACYREVVSYFQDLSVLIRD